MVGRKKDMAHVFYQSWHKPHAHLTLGFKSDYPNEASLSEAAALPRSHSTDGHHVLEPLTEFYPGQLSRAGALAASDAEGSWEVGRWPHVAGTVAFVCH